jgi:hypothetical protein
VLRRNAHGHSRKPIAWAVLEGLSDNSKSRPAEKGLGTEVGIVVAGALGTCARVRFNGRSAVLSGICHRGPDQGNRNATATGGLAHGYAWDDPNVLVIDARRRTRRLNSRKLPAGRDGNPTNGITAFEGK